MVERLPALPAADFRRKSGTVTTNKGSAMEPIKIEQDVLSEFGRSSTASEKLWIYITPLEKNSELARLCVGNKTISLRYSKAIIQSCVQSMNSFSISPNIENENSGDFRAIDFSASGISSGSEIQICIQVDGLDKGDKFKIYSSYYPYGFKKLTIKKYDPDGQLQMIHEKEDLPDAYSVYLDWLWI